MSLSAADLHTWMSRDVPPDYVSLIRRMQCYIEPEISCSRFFADACLASRQTDGLHNASRTELGEYIHNHMHGAAFVDMPCGLHAVRDAQHDVAIPPLAAALGAMCCIEVDCTAEVIGDRMPNTIDVIDAAGNYVHDKSIGDIGSRKENGMPVFTMQDDVLGWLAKASTERTFPVVIYLSALQPRQELCDDPAQEAEVVVPYITALFDELARMCDHRDLIILNSSDMLVQGINQDAYPFIHPAIALPERGFTLVRRCPLNKVHVFLRNG
jgi:hypothetical protein